MEENKAVFDFEFPVPELRRLAKENGYMQKCMEYPIKSAVTTHLMVIIHPNGHDEANRSYIVISLQMYATESVCVNYKLNYKNDDNKLVEVKGLVRNNVKISTLTKTHRNNQLFYNDDFLSGKHLSCFLNDTFTFQLIVSLSDTKCQSVLTLGIANHLFNKATSDVDIIVEGSRIPAHKLILCIASPVFAAMFETPMRESATHEIVISDFSESVVRSVLRCIYDRDAVQDLVDTQWDQVLLFADKYGMSDVENALTNYLISEITFDNAIEILLSADLFDIDSIKRAVFLFISSRTAYFWSLPDFTTRLGCRLCGELLEFMVGKGRYHKGRSYKGRSVL